MRRIIIIVIIIMLGPLAWMGLLFLTIPKNPHVAPTPSAVSPTPSPAPIPYTDKRSEVVGKYSTTVPPEGSETATGVKTRFKTGQKAIALTFDACGGPNGSGYDKRLVDFLITEKIPATLFINSRFIDANPEEFKVLAENNLFEIANHGLMHKPCSVSGQSAYEIKGTADVAEVFDEIQQNAQKIRELTGRQPKFYRSGTAFTDEVCPQIAWDIGEYVVNYSVLGDAGGTYPAKKVRSQLMSAEIGDIVLLHINKPTSGTAQGVISAIPELKSQGFEFVKLSDVELE